MMDFNLIAAAEQGKRQKSLVLYIAHEANISECVWDMRETRTYKNIFTKKKKR